MEIKSWWHWSRVGTVHWKTSDFMMFGTKWNKLSSSLCHLQSDAKIINCSPAAESRAEKLDQNEWTSKSMAPFSFSLSAHSHSSVTLTQPSLRVTSFPHNRGSWTCHAHFSEILQTSCVFTSSRAGWSLENVRSPHGGEAEELNRAHSERSERERGMAGSRDETSKRRRGRSPMCSRWRVTKAPVNTRWLPSGKNVKSSERGRETGTNRGEQEGDGL